MSECWAGSRYSSAGLTSCRARPHRTGPRSAKSRLDRPHTTRTTPGPALTQLGRFTVKSTQSNSPRQLSTLHINHPASDYRSAHSPTVRPLGHPSPLLSPATTVRPRAQPKRDHSTNPNPVESGIVRKRSFQRITVGWSRRANVIVG